MVEFRTLFLSYYFSVRCLSELIYPINNSNLYYPGESREWNPYLRSCPDKQNTEIDSNIGSLFNFIVVNIILLLIATALAVITHLGIKLYRL